jgi:tRNA 2-selenouridine synthase SelU
MITCTATIQDLDLDDFRLTFCFHENMTKNKKKLILYLFNNYVLYRIIKIYFFSNTKSFVPKTFS